MSRYGRQKRQDRGKKVATDGKKWQGGWQKRQGYEELRLCRSHIHATMRVTDCQSVSLVHVTRYAVVQVLATRDSTAIIELNYHKSDGVSRV